MMLDQIPTTYHVYEYTARGPALKLSDLNLDIALSELIKLKKGKPKGRFYVESRGMWVVRPS